MERAKTLAVEKKPQINAIANLFPSRISTRWAHQPTQADWRIFMNDRAPSLRRLLGKTYNVSQHKFKSAHFLFVYTARSLSTVTTQ